MSLREYIRLYFIIESQYIKARMQYRADFIISSVGIFFTSLTTLGIFWVMFNSTKTLGGWTFMEMTFMYAFFMIAVSPMQILFDQIWQLRYDVTAGNFLKYYFRPLNMMFYYMSERFDIKGLTQLVAAIILLIYSSTQLGIEWTPLKLVFLPFSLLGASLVFVSIGITAGCAAFWMTNSFPIMSLAWKLREFSPYPMTIFDGAFRFFFTFIVPIGFIAFYPSQMFVKPEQLSPWMYLSPLVGVVMFAITYWIWTKGVNSYTGTGS